MSGDLGAPPRRRRRPWHAFGQPGGMPFVCLLVVIGGWLLPAPAQAQAWADAYRAEDYQRAADLLHPILFESMMPGVSDDEPAPTHHLAMSVRPGAGCRSRPDRGMRAGADLWRSCADELAALRQRRSPLGSRRGRKRAIHRRHLWRAVRRGSPDRQPLGRVLGPRDAGADPDRGSPRRAHRPPGNRS